jgi:ribosomal protein L14
MRFTTMCMMAVLATGVAAAPLQAQEAPRQLGTVKATSASGLTLTTSAGQDVTVTVPATAKVMVVPPGSTDLKSATAGALSDIAAGDKALVTGTAGDTPTSLNAVRVIVMKASALAQSHAAEDAAWAKGGGGIVKSVDAAAGRIMVASGMKMMTVSVTPATIIRRYSGDSVRFADAKAGTIADIRPGDQLRVRGTKSEDGSTITADELVTGTFHNYSGLIASIDLQAGTITLKDLTTKKTVTVAVTSNSDVHRLPPFIAQRVAAQMKGTPGAAGGGAPGGGAPGGAAPGGEHAGGSGEGAGRAGRAGMDLSQMLSRLPAETLSGLKVGDAVMIVATAPSATSEKSTAVTLLTGVDPILQAAPEGQTSLSPWSIGGGGADMGGGGEGGGPGGGGMGPGQK